MEEKQTENFTVLDEFGKLKIFNSATEIIKYFVGFRLTFYQKRKDYLINKLTEDLEVLSNRARFIKMIIEKRLNINNVPKGEVILKLDKEGFSLVNESYTYLLSMPIHTLTKEKYEELLANKAQKEVELEKIKKLDPIDMYKEDLKELKKAISYSTFEHIQK
jgi:DNA topoisomerase-2